MDDILMKHFEEMIIENVAPGYRTYSYGISLKMTNYCRNI
jgi:hypothetical protein